ncbi:aldose epimerase family protein [Pseudophaeobacter sp.]|uniref:aldose epimerase family protein n=1 Tax=Pseudophaeobacter sp. TaxID=1971739 RepID=UPI0032967D67
MQRQVLSNGDVSLSILNLGCITQDWQVPLGRRHVPVVLGYQNPQDYLNNPCYLGAIVGRVANRISRASFDLGGQHYRLPANDGTNCLHGGLKGIGARLWDISADGNRVVQLTLTSEDGDQGFPGRVQFEVTISLEGHTVTYDMRARVDRPTPINLAQHSYYNLMGSGAVSEHILQLPARQISVTDCAQAATGETREVTGSRFDFTQAQALAKADPKAKGYDHNYILPPEAAFAAKVTAPNGLRLLLETDQPCLQVYTATHLQKCHVPLPGQVHHRYGGLCLEAQGYPNAPNLSSAPSILATPERPYHHQQRVTICAS